VFVDFANGCQVFEPVAVVRGRPYCRKLAIEQLLIAFLTDLMSSVDPDAAVCVQEALDDVCSEHVPGATVRKFESTCVVVGIGPHQVSEGTFVWDLFYSFDLTDVVDVLKRR